MMRFPRLRMSVAGAFVFAILGCALVVFGQFGTACRSGGSQEQARAGEDAAEQKGAASAPADDAADANPVGRVVPEFDALEPAHDRTLRTGFRQHPATVVAFIGTDCGLTTLYVQRLVELQERYAERGVQFLAVNPNPQDSAKKVAEYATRKALPFAILKDEAGHLTQRFGATRTPEAFIVDASGRIRYAGRIDDQFGIGFRRPSPTSEDLADALDDVLAHRPVRVARTEATGCAIYRPAQPVAPGKERFTYGRDIAPIIEKHCWGCHQPGQIGPMAFATYEDARDWSTMIREVVTDGIMPPWYANPDHGEFANDRRLAPDELEALITWIDEDCPRGPERPPLRPSLATGWTIEPQAVFTMTEAFEVPADAPPPLGVPYQYFTMKTDFPEDRWITAAEILPGAPEVVHHALVGFLYPGETATGGARAWKHRLSAFVPGRGPQTWPKGTAKRLPAGATIVIQVHYTPNGTAIEDQTSIGFTFAEEPPERMAYSIPIWGRDLRIPAGVANHEIVAAHVFEQDVLLLSLMPHMHLRGKDFQFERFLPGSRTSDILLDLPLWDFNWQYEYVFAQPLPVVAGTTIQATAHYDNSPNNPNNPDPTKEVRYGEQTWDEMMVGTMEVTFPFGDERAIRRIEDEIWRAVAPNGQPPSPIRKG